LQKEIDAMKAAGDVHILGVNQVDQESANTLLCEGRDIPWLQETIDSQVWIPWDVVYRDVIILNGDNERAAVFNLTVHDLSVAANYDSLRSLLLDTTP
jgi:hypothetical protein